MVDGDGYRGVGRPSFNVKTIGINSYFPPIFRWFKFTLKPPNSMARGNFFLEIWDTSHWNFFVKFGLKTPYDIS